jgi:hypothetical protein
METNLHSWSSFIVMGLNLNRFLCAEVTAIDIFQLHLNLDLRLVVHKRRQRWKYSDTWVSECNWVRLKEINLAGSCWIWNQRWKCGLYSCGRSQSWAWKSEWVRSFFY